MITLINQNSDYHNDAFLDKIKAFAQTILAEFGEDDSELNIVLCNDDFICSLNKEYRKKDYPTDVLSFRQMDNMSDEGFLENDGFADMDTEGGENLGDIVVSTDRARVQSAENGFSLEEELAFLVIHGVLHILGYDHETSPEDEKEMFALQEEYLKRFTESYLK